MTHTCTDAFLSGQGIPVELRDIESELIRLWGPAAERIGGPELENPNVTRLVLANLVVEAGGHGEGLEATLDAVVARYPCRAIVIRRDDDPERKVRAEVAALCHLPAPGQPQVCSERIVLRSGPGAIDLVPGAVRPLLEADLPYVLWWTGDPRECPGLFRDLADECTRLIVDLPDPEAEPAALRMALDPELNEFGRDVAWFGISRWRELVAQFFDGPGHAEGLKRLKRIEVEVATPTTTRVPRAGAWLVGWLAGQLGWEPRERTADGQGGVEATFVANGRNEAISVSIRTVPLHENETGLVQIEGVQIEVETDDGPEVMRLTRPTRGCQHVRIEVSSPHVCALPRTVLAPELDAPRRLSAGLESARHDRPFQNARPAAFWLLGDGIGEKG